MNNELFPIVIDNIKLKQQKTATELELLNSNTFIALKKKLLEISDQKSFLDAVCDLSYIKNIRYEEDSEPMTICTDNNIDDKLHYKNDYFKCLCGKTHLKNLNIFSLKNKSKNLIIGSTCIDQISKLSTIHKENVQLLLKITEILELVDIDIMKKENNTCMKCGDFCIKKNYDYKNPFRKIVCKTCIINNNYIHCKDCPKKIKIEQLRGTIKRRCISCWYKDRNKKKFH